MTIHAQYWVHESGRAPIERVTTLSSRREVDEFVRTLADERVGDALLTHARRPRVETAIPDEDNPAMMLTVPDHSVIVGVHGNRGALSYQGNDGHVTDPVHLYSQGHGPDHSVLYETDEFPPDCEVDVTTLANAVGEFLRTAKRPTGIDWQPAHDSTPQ